MVKYLFVYFLDRALLCTLVALKLKEIHLPLPPECGVLRCVSPYLVVFRVL